MAPEANDRSGPLSPGELLAGKYRIERLLGAGGMGTVYAAYHELLRQRVAVKLLKAEIADNAGALARFLNEARAAASIQNEHVARVMDVGQLEGGTPYMVLEYLEGTDLAVLLDRRGPLPVAEAVDYVLQALEALAQAHSAGIVHRDLKPANLFVSAQPSGDALVKVLDFGISKANALLSPDGAITTTESILGTPSYMSPEQLRSTKNVDHRTDVWALGVILYELLAGRPPFAGSTVGERLVAVIEQPIPPLRSVRPDVPPELEDVVMRCLARDLRARTQDVAQLATELAPFGPPGARDRAQRVRRTLGAEREPSGARERTATFMHGAEVSTGSPNSGQTETAWRQEDRVPRSGRRGPGKWIWPVIVGVVAIVALAGGAWRLVAGPQVVPVEAKPSSAPEAPAPEPALAPEPTFPAPSVTTAIPRTPPAVAGKAKEPRRETPRPGASAVAPASSVEYSPSRDSRL